MIMLIFEGWFQCRLATNPDPSDERRGISGYSFALAGEPDLDRIIRFNDPIHPRSHGPKVGVAVCKVFRHGQEVREHALVGARVDLLDAAKFEAANGILAREPYEPILPFRLAVSIPHLGTVVRADMPGPSRPYEMTPAELKSQAAKTLHTRHFAAQAGVPDPVEYRLRRLRLLEKDLQQEKDPLQVRALEKRIHELRIPDAAKARALVDVERRLLFMRIVEIRTLRLQGRRDMDFSDVLGGQPDVSEPWHVELWMGVWDVDALCGFVRGTLVIPFQEE